MRAYTGEGRVNALSPTIFRTQVVSRDFFISHLSISPLEPDILLCMKVVFEYSREKDIWCLLNYGKTSSNSPTPTKIYEQLVTTYGDTPSVENASQFINDYLSSNGVLIDEYKDKYQLDWDSVADKYQKIAEDIFKVEIKDTINAYITVNSRHPYSIEGNLFFVKVPSESVRKTVMHELWHFYTWYKFGITWQEKIGAEKYNEIKEALTVLLNVECKGLLPDGVLDMGYSQHQELRSRILELWSEERDIEKLWQKLVH